MCNSCDSVGQRCDCSIELELATSTKPTDARQLKAKIRSYVEEVKHSQQCSISIGIEDMLRWLSNISEDK